MVLTLSLLIRVVTLGWCLATLRRVRGWQLAVIALVLVLMVFEQALAVADLVAFRGEPVRWQALLRFGDWHQLLGLSISAAGLFGVVAFGRMLQSERGRLASLRERDVQFANASRIAELGTFEVDLDRCHVTCSLELERLLGLRHEDAGHSVDALTQHLDDDGAARFAAQCDRMARGDEGTCNLLVCLPQAGGMVRRLHARGELVDADGGRSKRMVGVFVDVTEEASIREALEDLARGRVDSDAGEGVTEWLVQRLADALGTDYAFLAELDDHGGLRTVAVCANGEIVDNFGYDVVGTPCGVVTERGLCVLPTGVQRQYPQLQMMKDLGVEGYAGARLEDRSGNVVGVLGVMHTGPIARTRLLDTLLHVYSMRAATELARQHDLEQLRMTRFAMDHAGDCIFLVDRDARIVDANDTACRRMGFQLAELKSMRVWDIDKVFPRERWSKLWSDLEEHGVVRLESRHLTRTGEEIPIELVLSFVSFRGADHLLAMVRDISARVEQTRELEFRQFLVDNAADAVFTIANDGRFLNVNEAACVRLGYRRDELLQMRVWDIDRLMPEALWPGMWDRVKGGRPVTVDVEHVTKDGRGIPVEVVGRYVEYLGQQCIVAFARDVTERKQAEQERRQLENELRHSQKMEAVGTLAGGIAHDFNNLLTTVLGNVDLAKVDLDDREAVQESLEAIEDVAHQGGAMTQSLLMFAHKSQAERTAVNLCQLVTDTVKMFGRLLPASIELLESLPETPLWIVGDASQLQQVLMNLAVNAQQAMPNGGKLRIELSELGMDGSEEGGGGRLTASLVVADTGCGMDDETQKRMFEPFFTTRPRGEGTGLGLSMVHGIVSEHGGTVRVDSTVGKGTSFELRLPVAVAEDEVEKDVVLPSLEPMSNALIRASEVLVAEDNTFVRRLVTTALQSMSCRVSSIDDGEQAVRLFLQNPDRFGLAVLDIDMPRLSGLECLERMRRLRPDLPVLMVSGNAALLADAEARGDVTVLAKPFRMGHLVQQVSVLLDPPVGT